MDGWGNLENSNVAITFHDAFQGCGSWNSWGSGMWNLMLDTHHYEIFDQVAVSMSPADHVGSACGFGGQMRGSNKWAIAGEWTGAMTDCAQWLNGYGKGARYDGTFSGSSSVGSCHGLSTGSVSQLSTQQQEEMTRFVEAQMDAFESAAGWLFWTWKTEGAPGWDMQDMLNNGIFQRPVTGRKYPGQC
jgi:glucan 1,3-beta-glucosidase